MPNKGIITHTEIAEPNLTKPVIDDFIAWMAVMQQAEAQIKDIAKGLKVAFKGADFKSTDGLDNFVKQTKLATEAVSALDKVKKEQRATNDKINAELTLEAQLLAETRLELERIKKETKEWTKLNSEQTGAYEKASIKLNQLRKAWKDLAVVEKENTVEAKALKKELDALDITLKKIDAAAGQHQRNVGNYASAYNGLGHSINQLSRELPAFTNSMQTGFIALSNNIPMLADELKKLNEANKQLNAEGKQGVPVWKQVASSLFSWQTALSVGITLLTVYGEKIFNAIAGTEKAVSATDRLTESQKKLNKEISGVQKGIEDKLDKTISKLNEQRNSEILLTKARFDALKEEDKTFAVRSQHAKDLYDIEVKYNTKSQQEAQKALNDESNRVFKRINELSSQINNLPNNKYTSKDDLEKRSKLQQEMDDLKIKAAEFSSRLGEIRDSFDKKNREELLKLQVEEIALRTKNNEDKEKLLIEALELQHKINVLEIESIKDANQRKKLLMEEEAAFEMQMNFFRIKDAQKREEVNMGITKKFEREMRDILDAEDKAFKDSLDKQFDDLMKQQDGIRDREIELDQYYRKKQIEKDKEDEKARKEALKAQQKFLKDSISLLEQNSKNENQIRQNQIAQDIEGSKRRQDQLKDLAIQGSKDAADSIALEEKRQAELEAKKFREQKRQKRQELFFAGIRAYTANLEANPTIALQKTLKDLAQLSAGLNALPAFEKGTEDTGEKGRGVDGKGGFHAILHPNERVLTKGQNRKIGDMSNDELANLAFMWQRGVMPDLAMANHVDDRLIDETKGLRDEIIDLKKVIENKPTQRVQYDELGKVLIDVSETKYNRNITRIKLR